MVETKEQHKKIQFNCVAVISIGQCLASEHQLRSSLMLEQDRLVLLVPNPFPSELLTVFFT